LVVAFTHDQYLLDSKDCAFTADWLEQKWHGTTILEGGTDD